MENLRNTEKKKSEAEEKKAKCALKDDHLQRACKAGSVYQLEIIPHTSWHFSDYIVSNLGLFNVMHLSAPSIKLYSHI